MEKCVALAKVASCKNMIIAEACGAFMSFFLVREDENISLGKTHIYYVQIEEQLMVSGCKYCKLIV